MTDEQQGAEVEKAQEGQPAGYPNSDSSGSVASPHDGEGYDEYADDWDESDSILTWKLLVGLVVALIVVAVVAMALFGNKKNETGSARGATTGGTNPAVPTIRDDFDRPDNPDSLGKTPSGEDWQAVLGTWGVKNKQAYVAQKNAGPRNVAVIDLGQGDGSVSAKAAKMAAGWGLVFRYRGPNAYWAIEAVNLSPEKPTSGFKLLKIENGTPTNVQGANCVKQLSDGSEVRVEFTGPVISVIVDGKAICTVTDSYLQAQTKVGLFVTEQGVATARWSDFVATKGLAGPPVTVKRQTPPATGSQTGPGGQQPSGGQGVTTTVPAVQPGAARSSTLPSATPTPPLSAPG